MVIKINGEKRDVEESMTVEGLLSLLGIRRDGTAVELNREIVPRSLYGETLLKDGDSLEVIRMVGGGGGGGGGGENPGGRPLMFSSSLNKRR